MLLPWFNCFRPPRDCGGNFRHGHEIAGSSPTDGTGNSRGREGLLCSHSEALDQVRAGDQDIFLGGRSDGICVEVAVERRCVFSSFDLFDSKLPYAYRIDYIVLKYHFQNSDLHETAN
jgi:hypothetical protein